MEINRYFSAMYGDCMLIHNAPLWVSDLVKELHKKYEDNSPIATYEYSDWIMTLCRKIEGHINIGNVIDGELPKEHIMELLSDTNGEFYQWAANHYHYTFFNDAKKQRYGYHYNDDIEYLRALQSYIIQYIINKVYQGHLEEYNNKNNSTIEKYVVEFKEIHNRAVVVEACSAEEAEKIAQAILPIEFSYKSGDGLYGDFKAHKMPPQK